MHNKYYLLLFFIPFLSAMEEGDYDAEICPNDDYIKAAEDLGRDFYRCLGRCCGRCGSIVRVFGMGPKGQ
jgi:hypothetical protein